MNSRTDTIAVVGMACSFPGARNLDEYWYTLINGSLTAKDRIQAQEGRSTKTKRSSLPSSAESFVSTIKTCIQDALQDAGLSTDPSRLEHTNISIGLDPEGFRFLKHAYSGQTPEASMASSLGIRSDQVALAVRPVFDPLQVVITEMERLEQKKSDLCIVVAVQSECPQHEDNAGRLENTQASESYGQEGLEGLVPSAVAAVILQRPSVPGRSDKLAYGLLKRYSALEPRSPSGNVSPVESQGECIGFVEVTSSQLPPELDRHLQSFCHSGQARFDPSVLCPLGITHDAYGVLGIVRGLASLIKVALCASNKLIPPFDVPEKFEIPPTSKPFFTNHNPRPWIKDPDTGPRAAALVSVGEDGRIDCLGIQEMDPRTVSGGFGQRPIKTDLDWDSELVVLTAPARSVLVVELESLRTQLTRRDHARAIRLVDVAFTQALRFDTAHPVRIAMVCRDLDELMGQLLTAVECLKTNPPVFKRGSSIYYTEQGDLRPGNIAFVFPGQGFPGLLGPYIDHLRDLCLRFPEVREAFDVAENRDRHPEDPLPTSHVFFPPSVLTEEERNQIRQRLASPRLADAHRMQIPDLRDLSSFGVFVANWGCWNLLQSLEVPVDALFGQSHGELSALCAAGALDYKAVLPMHWQVEYDPDEFIKSNGRLLAVSAKEETLAPYLSRYYEVINAIHVSPELQILGGEGNRLQELAKELKTARIWTQSLPYPAIHTAHFSPLRPAVGGFLRSLAVHPFRIPVYSGMICGRYPEDLNAVPDIMVANLDHPVLLWQTHRKMYEDGIRVFVQVGGGATMYAQAKHNTGAEDVLAVSLDVDYRSAITQLNHLCATLTTHGIPVNLEPLYRYRSARPLELPRQARSVLHDTDPMDLPAPGFRAADTHEGQVDRDALLRGDMVNPQDEPRMPFIGHCIHFIEGQEIVVDRMLSLDEDLFLHDHLFVYAKGIKPISARFPIVPMTMSLELMAEVAAFLAPGCGLLGFEEIKAKRWIEMDHVDTLALRTKAILQNVDENTGAHRIKVDVFIADQETSAIEGIVVFGQSYLVEMEMNFSQLENPRPYPLTPYQIYTEERQLFHGPVFQSISGDCLLGDAHVLGELTVLPKDTMFRSTQSPQLLCDPALLDAVGQLVGLWSIDKGVYLFPIGLDKLEIYCQTPPVGTRAPVYLQITQFSSHFLFADVEVQDGSGGVWMRIRKWGDWLFRWPENVFRFRCQPQKHCVSHGLNLSDLPDGAVSRWIMKKHLKDSDSHVMLLTMASFYLHMDEMPRFFELEKFPKRQFQWLLGRIAAKDAVRIWLARRENTAEMLHPASFSIVNDSQGQPVVLGIPEGSQTPRVSISHTQDRAIAIAHSGPVGVDIEPIRPKEEGFLNTITSPGERQRLARYLNADANTWTMRLWCAKEAAGKLLGSGLLGQPLNFEALEVDPGGGITIRDHRTGSTIVLKTQEQEESPFAIAYTTATSWSPDSFQQQDNALERR